MRSGPRILTSSASVLRAVAVFLFAGLAPLASHGGEPTLAEKLCSEYAKIESVSSEIQKTITTGGKSVKWLSRVFYRKDDRIHVENVTPEKRRIVADGKSLCS